MSAAATQRVKQIRSRRVPLPPELNEEIEIPEKNFGKIPNNFWRAFRHKFQTGFEKDIASLLAERSYGGHPDGSGGWKNPKWVELPASEVAIELGNVDEEGYPKTEGIEKCLKALESDERRLIESKLVGRVKYYRLCPENFAAAPDRQVRTAERKPPESAEEAHICEVAPSEPLIMLAGEKRRPFLLGAYRGKITSGFTFPIAVLPLIDEDGDLDISVRPHKGEGEAKTNRRTPVRLSARALKTKGVAASNGSRPPTSPVPEKSASDRRQEAAAQIEEAEHAVMRDFLIRWCGKELGEPKDETVGRAIAALGGASMEDFARRIKKRVPEVPFLTWNLVVDLAKDAAQAFEKRNARLGRPATAPSNLTAEQIAEFHAHYARKKS